MNKLSTYIVILLCINISLAFSQTNETYCKYMVKGIPQYLFKNGIRIDFDHRRGNTSTWITYSPSFYIDYGRNNITSLGGYNKMLGGGFNLELKKFAKNSPEPLGFYFGPGASWNYYRINLSNTVWVNAQENGQSIILPAYKNYNENLNKLGLNGIIGYQETLWDSFYFDIYCGFGIRYSFYRSPNGPVKKFNESNVDFGYTGMMLVGGIRFGVAW